MRLSLSQIFFLVIVSFMLLQTNPYFYKWILKKLNNAKAFLRNQGFFNNKPK